MRKDEKEKGYKRRMRKDRKEERKDTREGKRRERI